MMVCWKCTKATVETGMHRHVCTTLIRKGLASLERTCSDETTNDLHVLVQRWPALSPPSTNLDPCDKSHNQVISYKFCDKLHTFKLARITVLINHAFATRAANKFGRRANVSTEVPRSLRFHPTPCRPHPNVRTLDLDRN